MSWDLLVSEKMSVWNFIFFRVYPILTQTADAIYVLTQTRQDDQLQPSLTTGEHLIIQSMDRPSYHLIIDAIGFNSGQLFEFWNQMHNLSLNKLNM